MLGANPGHIKAEVTVTLPRPRDRRSPRLRGTRRPALRRPDRPRGPRPEHIRPSEAAASPLTHPLPQASVGGLAGLVEIVYARDGQADLPDLADELSFDVDHLLPFVDAAVMLGLLELEGADRSSPTPAGTWYTADIQTSKQIFARLAVANAPLVRTICRALDNSNDGALRDDFFRDLLRRGFSDDDAERQLDLAIDWGRYGELYDYDADTDQITADPAAGIFPRPERAVPA